MNKHPQKQIAMQLAKGTLILFVSTTLLLWAWNNAITTIFSLPAIHFKEAMGLLILVFGIRFIFRGGQHGMLKRGGEAS